MKPWPFPSLDSTPPNPTPSIPRWRIAGFLAMGILLFGCQTTNDVTVDPRAPVMMAKIDDIPFHTHDVKGGKSLVVLINGIYDDQAVVLSFPSTDTGRYVINDWRTEATYVPNRSDSIRDYFVAYEGTIDIHAVNETGTLIQGTFSAHYANPVTHDTLHITNGQLLNIPIFR